MRVEPITVYEGPPNPTIKVNGRPSTSYFCSGIDVQPIARKDWWTEDGQVHIPDFNRFPSRSKVRDFFESEVFVQDQKMHFIFHRGMQINAGSTEHCWTVDFMQRLVFDYDANVFYSHIFIFEPPVEVSIQGLLAFILSIFAHDPYGIAHPKLTDEMALWLPHNDKDRAVGSNQLLWSRLLIVYADAEVSDELKGWAYALAEHYNIHLRIRDRIYSYTQSMNEKALAFISHDSRDKATLARPLAEALNAKLGRIWYDEYSLQIGDNLRQSIERGLRECEKCVVVLTPNFLGNERWAQREFDGIFAREIAENKQFILPVWSGVTEMQVAAYSTNLLNRAYVTLTDNYEEVAEQLSRAIWKQH